MQYMNASQRRILLIYIAHFIISCCGSMNFMLGLHFISVCFKPIIIHYDTPKQWEIKLF